MISSILFERRVLCTESSKIKEEIISQGESLELFSQVVEGLKALWQQEVDELEAPKLPF